MENQLDSLNSSFLIKIKEESSDGSMNENEMQSEFNVTCTDLKKESTFLDASDVVFKNIKEEPFDPNYEDEMKLETKMPNLLELKIINTEVKIENVDIVDDDLSNCVNSSSCDKNDVKQRFKCDICFQFMETSNGLKKHKLSHDKGKQIKTTIIPRQFKCKICPKKFTSSSYVRIHERLHTGEKRFRCNTCFKLFACEPYLEKHKRFQHTREKSFECGVCFNKFAYSSQLNKHYKIHTGEKPFECNTCFKRFFCPSHLERHERIHTGEKPFKCEICFKTFTHLYNLKLHKPIHTGMKNRSNVRNCNMAQ